MGTLFGALGAREEAELVGDPGAHGVGEDGPGHAALEEVLFGDGERLGRDVLGGAEALLAHPARPLAFARGEEELEDGLNRLFPTAHVEDKHATPTAGDFLVHVGRLRLMVETKSYTRNVQKGEIDKFYRDVDGPGTAEANCAVLLSMDSGICCKEDLSLEVRNGKPVMFVHNLRHSYDRLLLVVKVLDAIIGAAGSIDISHAETSEKLRDLVKSMKRSFTSQKTRLDKYCKAQLDSIAEQEARLIEVAVAVGLPGAGARHQTGPRSAPSLVVKTEAAPLSQNRNTAHEGQ